ncbi:MAG: MarC family protein [Candidatus Micrarchaeota archaeon]|nr:MarC family protein [Candidatus Micrarchaeota archaeon]
MIEIIGQILSVFVILLAILDPFMAAPPFLAMTRKMKEEERAVVLREGIIIAAGIMIITLFIGKGLLELFGISIESFQIAGGILMFILGTQIVLGLEIVNGKDKKEEKTTLALLLGTPLLAGPASITTMILISQTTDLIAALAGLMLAIIVTYAIMLVSNKLVKRIGTNTLQIFSRFMGLLLAAFGIEFIKRGIILIIGQV